MTKKELATLYFPHLNPLKASDALARWIARAPTLQAALEQTGYEKTMRTLTPPPGRTHHRPLRRPMTAAPKTAVWLLCAHTAAPKS